MSSDEYVSKLNRAASGMGAAYAKNRDVMGIPQEEAKETPNLEIVADLVQAVVSGSWVPVGWPEGVKDAQRAEQLFLQQTNAARAKAHEEMQAAVEKRLEAEVDEELSNGAQSMLLPDMDPDDPLYNSLRDRQRRIAIEERLEPISFEDLVFKGYASQVIPLREGLSVTLRTMPTQHALWLEAMMSSIPDQGVYHMRHYFSLMTLGACLDEVNGKPLRGEGGQSLDVTKYWDPSDEAHFKGFQGALKERMRIVARMPQPLSDDLIVQNTWFGLRVRKLFIGDVMRKVGNS